MRSLDLFDSKEVGRRLRIAREAVNLTQKNAADMVNFARTTLVAIEKGERRVRFAELQQLAHIYKVSINGLFHSEVVSTDLIPRFRKLAGSDSTAISAAADLLTKLVRAEVELENLLGVQRRKNYPPERPILPGDVKLQAEQYAQELRQRLGLGLSPISDVITLLEYELDVRVYVRRIDSKISGLFAFDDAAGPCILLNANHPRERRTQSAIHETGHYLSTRSQPEVLRYNWNDNSREERFADAFARAFLTPAQGVLQKFRDVTSGADTLTRRHVIILSHFFGVSREAMVRRLEELELIQSGTWDWFTVNGGITDEQSRQVLGDLLMPDQQKAEADRPVTLRLSLLAAEVFKRQLMSEGQLARLLCLNRIQTREMLDDIEAGGVEVDGAPKLLA